MSEMTTMPRSWNRLRALAAMAAFVGAISVSAAPAAPIVLAQSSALPSVQGEVTRVNKDTGKVTIRHEPIPNLDMPAMTMVFALKDPAMIEAMNVGAKITFTADRLNGAFTVMSLDAVN